MTKSGRIPEGSGLEAPVNDADSNHDSNKSAEKHEDDQVEQVSQQV